MLHRPQWWELDDEAFVRQAYQRLLDRPADPDGLQNYVSQLRSGMPKAQIVAELEGSPEGRMVARRQSGSARPPVGEPHSLPASAAKSQASPSSTTGAKVVTQLLALEGEQFVREAYLAILGREADPAGLSYYGRRVAAGEPKEQILVDLRCDPEGQARATPVAGLDELVASAQAIAAAGPLTVKAASASELLTLHGREFVQSAYLTLFDRPADPEGLVRYLEVLRSGFSRSFVLAAFADSPEGKERAAKVTGLTNLLVGYRKGQRPSWRGWYWRNVRGAESDLTPAREARRLGWKEEG
jgi:hypothetical protein